MPADPESNATTASGCAIETVNLSNRVAWAAPYFSCAYICMMIAGIDTLMAVTAILSRSVISSNLLRCPALVLRYIGSEVIAATPSTLAAPRVLSHNVINAGGPAEMKSADDDNSASFIAAGPPRSIQRTVTSAY